MSSSKTLTVLIILTAFTVAGAYLTKRGTDAIPMSGKTLFPGLLQQVNDVERVVATGQGKSFAMEKGEGGEWTMPDREHYRAELQRVQHLLIGMAGLKRVEPKTDKPALYEKLGLGDPAVAEKGSDLASFVLEDGQKNVLAKLIVGNKRDARGDPNLQEYYVLTGEDPKVWLVQGQLPIGNTLGEWIDTPILGIEPERVALMKVTHPDGEVLQVSREQPHVTDFTLVDQPDGTKVKEKWQVDDIGRGIARLSFDDVANGKLETSGKMPAFTATMTTHDGMRVEMTAMYGAAAPASAASASSTGEAKTTADKAAPLFAVLSASFDETLVNTALLTKKRDNAKLDIAAMERGPARREAEALAKLVEPDEVKKEVEAANAKWAGWVYRLPEFKGTHLGRKMKDLVEKPAAPMEGPKPQPGSG